MARIRHKHTLKAKFRSYWKVPRHIAPRKIVVNVSMNLPNLFNVKLDFHRWVNFIFDQNELHVLLPYFSIST